MAHPLDGDVLAPGQEWVVAIGGDQVLVELVTETRPGRWTGLSRDGTLHVLPTDDPCVDWIRAEDATLWSVEVEVVEVDLDSAIDELGAAIDHVREALKESGGVGHRLRSALRHLAAALVHLGP